MDDSMSSASTIHIVSNPRFDRRRTGQRGLDTTVLARGVAAVDAINAANERTAAYKLELDSTRVRLGRCEDALKDHLRANPGAETAPPNGLPPDIFAAELLKRDALVNRWT